MHQTSNKQQIVAQLICLLFQLKVCDQACLVCFNGTEILLYLV